MLPVVASQNYGVAMPAFLEKVAANRKDLVVEVPAMIEEFNRSVLGGTSNNFERRFASKFWDRGSRFAPVGAIWYCALDGRAGRCGNQAYV